MSVIVLVSVLTNTEYTDALSEGISLSPLRSELSIAPGTSQDGTLSIKNNSNKQIKVQMDAEAFSVINQQYDYAFDAESQLSNWVQFDKNNIDINQGETAIITYKIGVPISAEPGGRYISLFASTNTDNDSNSIASRQRVGSLLYITVLGDVTRAGELISISSPAIVLSDSEMISFQLRNSGSTHYRSKYELKVTSLFGDTLKDSSGDSLILPGTIRRITQQLVMPTWPGIYKMHYQIGLGDNPMYVKDKVFLYIPIWSLLLIAALVGGIYTYFKIRKIRLSAEQRYKE